jgi:DnaJ-class molecular chaperone
MSSEELIDSEPPIIDPYEVLGLERDATADQIKSAYRKAALKNHPGMHPSQGHLLPAQTLALQSLDRRA